MSVELIDSTTLYPHQLWTRRLASTTPIMTMHRSSVAFGAAPTLIGYARIWQSLRQSSFCTCTNFRQSLVPLRRMGSATTPVASAEKLANETQPQKKETTKISKRVRKGVVKGALSSVGTVKPVIQWYPGHIAKAERALQDSIKLVDVIIEVRDCRIPIATAHPQVSSWVGNRARIVAMNRADLAPDSARSAWRQHLLDKGEKVRFINAKQGRGVKELKKLAVMAGSSVNDKRKKRGLLPRPVRALVIGYPNVGKSALINRLVGKNAAKSANKPGVTRNFQWVRISDTIELLDMPGIIPAKFVEQETALRLSICDDIGQAAYDRQLTAALMIEELKRVAAEIPGYFDLQILADRFKTDPRTMSGETFLYESAEKLHNGDAERTAVRLLTEFRSGVLGKVALEYPEMLDDLEDERPAEDNHNMG